MSRLASPLILLSAAAAPLIAQRSRVAVPKTLPAEEFLPANISLEIEQVAFPATGHFSYYISNNEIWLYDRVKRTTSRLLPAAPGQWALTVAPNGTALAFTRDGEAGKDQFVWTVPLDPRTGLVMGPPRQASMRPGSIATPAISPDGKLLAFESVDTPNGGSLVVLPLAGGPERVLFSVTGTFVNGIRFSPDSKNVYFGVNPPRARPTEPGTIQRVSVDGGKPVVLARVGDPAALVSPDGRLMVYRDAADPRRAIVADTRGTQLGSFTPIASLDDATWLPDSRLFLPSGGDTQVIKIYSLADGTSRTLVGSIPGAARPRWSPDGKQIAFFAPLGFRTEIVVMNADGSHQRRYLTKVHVNGAPRLEWSPDGRRIAYDVVQANHIVGVNAIDVTTGREVSMARSIGLAPVTWAPDSKHLYVSVGDPPMTDPTNGPPPGPRHLKLVDATVDGQSRVLRDTTLGGYSNLFVVTPNTLIFRGDVGDAMTSVPLMGSGRRAVLIPANSGFISAPAFSADGKWMAVRRNMSANNNHDMRLLDVVQLDGTHRTTINLPFAAAGGDNLAFLPGNQQVLIEDSSSIYRLGLPNGTPNKVLEIKHPWYEVPVFDLSPDGHLVLYSDHEQRPVTAQVVDFASMLRGTR